MNTWKTYWNTGIDIIKDIECNNLFPKQCLGSGWIRGFFAEPDPSVLAFTQIVQTKKLNNALKRKYKILFNKSYIFNISTYMPLIFLLFNKV